jgi:flagellar basal-body rod protein FlgG
MIRALSTAATGMEAQQTRLDVTANNIANVSTHGFKKSRAEFADLMYQNHRTPGATTGNGTQSPTGMQVGLGVRTAATHRMHGQGDLRQTGNPLDVAIEGRGFYQITLPSGEVAYTRDGAFKLSPEGQLVNADGYALADSISIPPDAQGVTIGADGTVSVTVPGETASVEAGQIQVTSFANESGLESMGKNLFRETTASGTAVTGPPGENGTGTLAQGTIEISNVNVVEEMIDLITGQRAYEVNSRVVKAADEMLGATANLR